MRSNTMTYSQDVINLAASMGVHPADVLMFAQSVANSISQDNMVDSFIDSDESTRTELSLAYAQHATKKFQSFTNTYLVNEVARSYFQSAVYAGGVA